MKLRKLKIHNIASIVDAEIDFESAPLADSSVFLIAGKTGAGKSTILDAICLALYGTTPRLAGTKMQGSVTEATKEIKTKDTRQLLRRGTGEGNVSLWFTTGDGTSYRAEWSVARAYKKVDRGLQDCERSLTNETTEETYSKPKEMQEVIQRLLGLDFTQFCRTTMLAQGEFSKFLNSKDEEKASILEKITGVDIYSRIGMRIFELKNEAEREFKTALGTLEGVRILGEEELAAVRETLAARVGEYDRVEKESENNKKKADWLRDDAALRRQREEAERNLREAREAVATDDFRERHRKLEQWTQTGEARDWLKACADASARIAREENSLDSLRGNCLTLVEEKLSVEAGIRKVGEKIEGIDSWLEGEKPREATYGVANDVLIHLDALVANRRMALAEESKVEKEEKTLEQQLRPKLQKADEVRKQAAAEVEQKKMELSGLERQLEAYDMPALRRRMQAQTERLGRLGVVRVEVKTYADNEGKLRESREELEDLKVKIGEHDAGLKEMEEPLRLAGEAVKRASELYESQKDTVDRFAASMRARLKEGDTCPVCRQTIAAAFASEAELAEIVRGYLDALNKAKEKYDGLDREKMRREAERNEMEKSREKLSSEIERRENDLAARKVKLLGMLMEFGVGKLDDTASGLLGELSGREEKERGELADKIGEGEKVEKKVKTCRAELDKLKDVTEKAEKAWTKVGEEIAECGKRMEVSRSLMSQKREEVKENESNIASLVSGVWKSDWKTAPEDFMLELRGAMAAYQKQREQREALASDLERRGEALTAIETALDSVRKLIPEWDEAISGIQEKGVEEDPGSEVDVRKVVGRMQNLLADVRSTLANLAAFREELTGKEALLRGFLEERQELTRERLAELNRLSAGDISALRRVVEESLSRVAAGEALCKDVESRWIAHTKGRPEFGEEDTLEALQERIAAAANTLRELGEAIGGLRRQLKDDAENRERWDSLKKEKDQKKKEFERWERLNKHLGSSDGSKFRRVAQSYVLESLLNSANHYLATLSGRYTLRTNPCSFVILVEDAYLGGERRIASTLSGGETFLVSLALALALSDIGDVTGMDVLFIDEGFGTLSGEPLQNAINTLHALHSATGKHVGIISHVEELREKIPVQIRVDQASNLSASTVTVVPCEKH